MNYDRYTGAMYDDTADAAAHLRGLLRRDREENERLREQVREVECVTVGGVEIEVDHIAGVGKKGE